MVVSRFPEYGRFRERRDGVADLRDGGVLTERLPVGAVEAKLSTLRKRELPACGITAHPCHAHHPLRGQNLGAEGCVVDMSRIGDPLDAVLEVGLDGGDNRREHYPWREALLRHLADEVGACLLTGILAE